MFLALKEKLFGNRSSTSKSLARSRLHFVLVQDRTGLTGDEMSSFKKEMIAVVEKYFIIDKSGFDIAYKRDVETTTLLINSPVVVRRRTDISQAGKSQSQSRSKSSGKNKDGEAASKPAAKDSAVDASTSDKNDAPLVAQT